MKLEKRYAEYYANYIKNRDRESLNQLMQALQPVMLKGINTFGYGIPTLRGRAKLLVLDAINSYDPSRGPLESHVMLSLQRLQRYAPDTGNVVKLPEGVRMLQRQVVDAEKELEDKYNRAPSDQELADYLGLSLKKIRSARVASGAIPESAFEGNVEMKSISQDNQEISPKVKLWQESVYKELSPIHQYIAERRLGIFGHKPEPVEQVAKRLKISPASVSNYTKEVAQKLAPPEDL